MTTTRARRTAAGAQRGAALLTAMIIVTLVATLASAMVWQQWRAVQVESAERARAQSSWILAGALDFGILILREDQKSGRKTQLTEPWATPLAESRLSTFLSAENSADTGDDGPEAFLSGTIADAQAKYNLANLITGTPEAIKKELQTLSRLCQSVGVDAGVATLIASGLKRANGSGTSTEAGGSTSGAAVPLMPATVTQLTWLGVTPASARALEPYVTILPKATAINVNTASKEVLAAATGTDLGTAERLVQIRQRTPFASQEAALKQLGVDTTTLTSQVDTSISEFFEVDGRLRLADHVVTQHTLVQRLAAPPYRKVLRRQLVSSIEEFGG